jgi:hypothetical protein
VRIIESQSQLFIVSPNPTDLAVLVIVSENMGVLIMGIFNIIFIGIVMLVSVVFILTLCMDQ